MAGRSQFAIALVLVFGLLTIGVAASGASSPTTGSISGTVMLDGEPLAGVSVSIWTPFEPEMGGWDTCTDGNGDYEISDVPLDVEFFSGVGASFGVLECENAKYFDLAGHPPWPLVKQFYDHSNLSVLAEPPTAFSAPRTDIDFDVIRLPDDSRAIVSFARRAKVFCFDRADGVMARSFLDKMTREINRGEDEGRIDPATAELYRSYVAIEQWDFNIVCPVNG